MGQLTLNWDAIGGITQIITVLYLFYQFHYLPRQERKAGIQNLKILWRLSEQKLDLLISEITEYCVNNNCADEMFTQGVTFNAQLTQLHYLKLTDLTEQAYNNIEKFAISKELIATMTDSVNKQISAFTQLQAHFNTCFEFSKK